MLWTNPRRAIAIGSLMLLTTLGTVGATPTTGTIIEGRGISGLELGTRQAEAEAVLGAPDRCNAQPDPALSTCSWSDPDSEGIISISFNDAEEPTRRTAKPRRQERDQSAALPVGAVSISVSFPGYATTAGIRPGSSRSDLIAAYGDSAVQCVFNVCLREEDSRGRIVTTTFDMGYRGLQGVTNISLSYDLRLL